LAFSISLSSLNLPLWIANQGNDKATNISIPSRSKRENNNFFSF
jgi:hypothetical protein